MRKQRVDSGALNASSYSRRRTYNKLITLGLGWSRDSVVLPPAPFRAIFGLLRALSCLCLVKLLREL